MLPPSTHSYPSPYITDEELVSFIFTLGPVVGSSTQLESHESVYGQEAWQGEHETCSAHDDPMQVDTLADNHQYSDEEREIADAILGESSPKGPMWNLNF